MYTVYRIRNTIDNRYYLGVHKTENPQDEYLGSGIFIRRAIKKYGRQNFIKDILFCFDDKAVAYDKEKELLCESLGDENCMNLSEGGIGGSNFKGKKHTEETKQKLREKSLGVSRKKTQEQLDKERKIRLTKNGKWFSDDAIKKMSDKKKGVPRSEETKRKISESRKLKYKNGSAE